LETELYIPIKNYLESQGFQVKGEIESIDVFAIKEDYTIAIELKNNITLKLIYQAIERQKLADDVFVAIPKTALHQHRKNLKHFKMLLRRLGIGLLIVEKSNVIVLNEPVEYNLELSKKRNIKNCIKLINNFNNLKSNQNIGGSKGKRMTVYREKVIVLATCLMKEPGLSPKELKKITGIENASSILQKDYYSWFERIDRGSYKLTNLGLQALTEEKEKTK